MITMTGINVNIDLNLATKYSYTDNCYDAILILHY